MHKTVDFAGSVDGFSLYGLSRGSGQIHIYMYIYICIRTYIYLHLNIHIHLYVCSCTYSYTYRSMYIQYISIHMHAMHYTVLMDTIIVQNGKTRKT